ncbi:MAG: enoyl-CoA hydratase/isomerase family protein [Spirochaetes bacterium]|nr:enoyl-CoA hydratase/isomerase family protein [Spirochaetota bacterium]
MIHYSGNLIALIQFFMQTKYHILYFKQKSHTAVIGFPGFSGNNNILQLYNEFADVCSEIEMNDDIRAVIITDAEHNTANANPPDSSQITGSLSLSSLIAETDRPVIAAVTGDATGQGFELIMACDIRIASNTSNFGLPGISKGVLPRDGGTQRLPRLAGKAKALEMILTGGQIDANEAFRTGLVNRTVSSGNILETAMELAADIASKAPVAVRYAREAIYKGADLALDQALRMEGDLYLLLYSTHDRLNGIQSFKDKKKPLFQGK